MPLNSAVHIDQPLSDFAVRYKNEEFIADQVLPVQKVSKRSDKYFTFSRKDAHVVPDGRIGPLGEANLSSYDVSTDSYSVEDFALKEYVSSQIQANADAPLSPEQDALDFLMERLMLLREIRVAALLFNASAYGTNNKISLTNEWDDTTSGTPVDDLLTGIEACAMRPNTLIIGSGGWKALRRHPQVISTVTGLRGNDAAGKGMVTAQQLADYLELDAIYIGRARKLTSNPGQSTETYGRVWDDEQALLCRVVKNPGTKDVTIGKTFRYSENGATEIQVRRWEEPKIGKGGSIAIQAEHSDDEKLVAPDCAYHFSNLLT